jgi:hypothetical protein
MSQKVRSQSRDTLSLFSTYVLSDPGAAGHIVDFVGAEVLLLVIHKECDVQPVKGLMGSCITACVPSISLFR